ncbi:MAG: hypothetical protein HOQ11_01730 [Gemmatimonadaceae bacterium]|nr:hypothetical protein [Gemmatimonadaceae bacterium]NUQ92509.1 hypothetical protein [Gemmatimonadaceae bacterium]NUR32404.1 hypothetical protein [Gemmatimonadaceae bacterium]NUS96110.1 hypothetical protein [Gemmatimonadaceae bacterium]
MRLTHIAPALALAASAITLGPSRAPAQSLDAEVRTKLGAGQFMQTTASLDKTTGQISATTKTANNSMFAGYTGAVGIVVVGPNNRIIASVQKWPFGVDGRMVPGKVANRTDVWTDHIDPALAAQATRIEVFHTYKALNRFAAILAEAGQRAREANDFKNQMCKEFGCAN